TERSFSGGGNPKLPKSRKSLSTKTNPWSVVSSCLHLAVITKRSGYKSCEVLASILSSKSSYLRELDLSNNDLKDSGVRQLCAGLQSPHCKLEFLRLSGCLITEEGFASLASALASNPSHLKDLDLTYNHPGETGVKLLSAGLDNPHWRLETLRYGEDSLGSDWIKREPIAQKPTIST
uniref:SPRY-associated domain-containing protein n=1 Tax=Poecilia mexicana TaxID=48701 RepID=A0A3B3YIU8_9TELE